MVIEEYVSGIIEKLRIKGVNEERLATEKERLMREYSDIFKLVDIYTEVDHYGDSLFHQIEEKEEQEEIDEVAATEERIKNWTSYYTEIEKKLIDETGKGFFDDSDRMEALNSDRFDFGRTKLHEAVMKRDISEIKRLIDEGCNTELKDNNGLTPFQTAIINGYTELIEVFREKGVME